jgi:hypothetical protein
VPLFGAAKSSKNACPGSEKWTCLVRKVDMLSQVCVAVNLWGHPRPRGFYFERGRGGAAPFSLSLFLKDRFPLINYSTLGVLD